jgi:hypothetical protein
MFQLDDLEFDNWKSQFVISNEDKPRQVFNYRWQGSLSFGSKSKGFGQEMVCFFKDGRVGFVGES